MFKLFPRNHKLLTLDDCTYINQALNEGNSFQEISRYL